MSESSPVIELIDVSSHRSHAPVDHVTLTISPGVACVLRGDAGASTLLRVLTLLDAPNSGELRIAGRRIDAGDDAARLLFRSRHFGFVFNSPYLLPELSVLENLAMPLFKVLGVDPDEARTRTETALTFAGLESLAGAPAGSLSRFDQERVAFARAVAHQPSVLVLEHADHHLAEGECRQLADLSRRARRELGVTVLIHYEHMIAACGHERVLVVENGQVREQIMVPAELEESQ
jgi:putative ABC transport system ATP-binding protein